MVLRVVVLMKLTLFGLSATECFAIMQWQYRLRNPGSSGIKVGDDFTRLEKGDAASLRVREVSSGTDAISENDPHAAAFRGEGSICPDLSKGNVQELLNSSGPTGLQRPSATDGDDGCVRLHPGPIGALSNLLNSWRETWGAKVMIYESTPHFFDGAQADEDRADPAVAKASRYIPRRCFRLDGIREWAKTTKKACEAIDGVEINQWPDAVATMRFHANSQII